MLRTSLESEQASEALRALSEERTDRVIELFSDVANQGGPVPTEIVFVLAELGGLRRHHV